MEIKTDDERRLYNIIVSIAEELNMKKDHVNSLGPYEIQSIIIKDIHIARILHERTEKELKVLRREMGILKQGQFMFAANLERYK